MKIIKARCTNCGSEHVFVNQSLDDVRNKVCERCRIKLTVVSSEGHIEASLFPVRERTVLTQRQSDIAKRLLVTAFGEE